MRSDIDHTLISEQQAAAALIQRHLEGSRVDETAAAHDEFGTAFLIGIQMELDLTIDHVLLTPSYFTHVRFNAVYECAEARSVPHKMGHSRAPQLVL